MQAAIYEPDQIVVTVANIGAALSILFTGLYRLYSEGEGKPEAYGLFAYGMASLSVLITPLFMASLWLL